MKLTPEMIGAAMNAADRRINRRRPALLSAASFYEDVAEHLNAQLTRYRWRQIADIAFVVGALVCLIGTTGFLTGYSGKGIMVAVGGFLFAMLADTLKPS